jgi:Carboxypeptidase regulatory-like domain
MDPFSKVSTAMLLLTLLLLSGIQSLFAQTATGSILGTVKDPSGAVVPAVSVTIKSVSTGTTRGLTTTDAGTYSAIALVPGDYHVSFAASSFGTGERIITVSVGETANGDFILGLAKQTSMIEVTAQARAEEINTVQAVVEDVLTGPQIDEIPLNGRNFLDLAQLNAGVQIQDGGNLDPTSKDLPVFPFKAARDGQLESGSMELTSPMILSARPRLIFRKSRFKSFR